jgi:hypothetical protein
MVERLGWLLAACAISPDASGDDAARKDATISGDAPVTSFAELRHGLDRRLPEQRPRAGRDRTRRHDVRAVPVRRRHGARSRATRAS